MVEEVKKEAEFAHKLHHQNILVVCGTHVSPFFLSFFPYNLFNVFSYGIVVPEHNQYGTEEAECGWCHFRPFFRLNPQYFSGVLMELAKSSVFDLIKAENPNSSLEFEDRVNIALQLSMGLKVCLPCDLTRVTMSNYHVDFCFSTSTVGALCTVISRRSTHCTSKLAPYTNGATLASARRSRRCSPWLANLLQ